MPLSKTEQLQISSRRSKVAALFLRGTKNQFEICVKLGMDTSQQSTISRDLKALTEEWKKSGVRDLDEAKGRELDRLDILESEAWAAWERSKVERQSTRTKRKSRAGKPKEDGTPTTVADDEAEVKKEFRDGDPRYLAIVLNCIEKRIAILGLAKYAEEREGGTLELVHEIVTRRAILSLPDKMTENENGETATHTNGTAPH